jgi:predicted ATPase
MKFHTSGDIMLTNLEIRNFKRFSDASIELGSPVVFIGPNNSGKTTALQSLALWSLGVRRWFEKRGDAESPGKRPGVALNRRDLVAVPVPEMNLLWRNLHVRNVSRDDGKQATQNVRIEISVTGVDDSVEWTCGLEFDYANEESMYCRPLRIADGDLSQRMTVPPAAKDVKLAYLPPMSGLADREFQKQQGEVDYLIGQGKTADVLRNLCYQVFRESEEKWGILCDRMRRLFGIALNRPELLPERSEITLSYLDRSKTALDLSSSGRGVQQTLLLLSYMMTRPGSVLLLDEPDAHLEILRQRQIYAELSEFAGAQRSQIIAASHSEVV